MRNSKVADIVSELEAFGATRAGARSAGDGERVRQQYGIQLVERDAIAPPTRWCSRSRARPIWQKAGAASCRYSRTAAASSCGGCDAARRQRRPPDG